MILIIDHNPNPSFVLWKTMPISLKSLHCLLSLSFISLHVSRGCPQYSMKSGNLFYLNNDSFCFSSSTPPHTFSNIILFFCAHQHSNSIICLILSYLVLTLCFMKQKCHDNIKLKPPIKMYNVKIQPRFNGHYWIWKWNGLKTMTTTFWGFYKMFV